MSTDALNSNAFRRALETNGAAVPARLEPSAAAGSQADRVRAISKQIAAAFQAFDSGRMSLDAFRAYLHDSGIVETPEATRLLSQGSAPSFTALFRALQAETPSGMLSSQQVGAPKPSENSTALPFGPGSAPPRGPHGRLLGPRPGERQLDPTSWTGDASVVGAGHEDRRAHVSAFNTAIAGNVLASSSSGYSVKGREVTSHLHAETGAGAVIRGQPTDAGVEYTTFSDGPGNRADRCINRMGAGPRANEQFVDSGAGALVAPEGDGGLLPRERFESHSQAATRTGLHGTHVHAWQAPPPTSAGYGGASDGLRETVHDLIRQFDAGRVTSAALRARLGELGAHPLPGLLERMIGDADRFGTRVDFARAVRCLEDFFSDAAARAPAPTAPPASAQGGHHRYQPGSTVAGSAVTGGGGGGITREQMLLRGEGGLSAPVRPSGYTASIDAPSFTRDHAIGGKYFSPHLPASLKSHGDIVGWQGEVTAPGEDAYSRRLRASGLAGNPNKAAEGTDRRLYDTHGRAVDIMPVQQRRQLEGALARLPPGDAPTRAGLRPTLVSGLGEATATLEQLQRARHVAPARYATAGNVTAFAGGQFDPREAQAELERFRRPQLARVGTGLAAYDRAAGTMPWASRE